MRPSMFLGAGGLTPSEFVGAALQTISGSPGTVNLTAVSDLEEGDYVLLFFSKTGTLNPDDIPGWERESLVWGSGYRNITFHRRIASTAPLAVVGLAGAALVIAAYRGASRAARRTVATSLGGPLIVPGVTRAADSVGLVSMISDRDADTGDFTPSSGWTRRALGNAGVMRVAEADVLPRASYTDGASMSWANTSGGYRAVQIYELLR